MAAPTSSGPATALVQPLALRDDAAMVSPWQIYYEVAAKQVEAQRIQHQELEIKSQRLTAMAGILTGLIMTLLTPLGIVKGWLIAPAAAVAASMLASAIFTFLVMQARQFSIGPRLDELESEVRRHTPSADHSYTPHIVMYAGSAMHVATCENEPALVQKARYLTWNTIAVLILLVAALLLTAAAFIITTAA